MPKRPKFVKALGASKGKRAKEKIPDIGKPKVPADSTVTSSSTSFCSKLLQAKTLAEALATDGCQVTELFDLRDHGPSAAGNPVDVVGGAEAGMKSTNSFKGTTGEQENPTSKEEQIQKKILENCQKDVAKAAVNNKKWHARGRRKTAT